jgi:hypothetical protein
VEAALASTGAAAAPKLERSTERLETFAIAVSVRCIVNASYGPCLGKQYEKYIFYAKKSRSRNSRRFLKFCRSEKPMAAGGLALRCNTGNASILGRSPDWSLGPTAEQFHERAAVLHEIGDRVAIKHGEESLQGIADRALQLAGWAERARPGILETCDKREIGFRAADNIADNDVLCLLGEPNAATLPAQSLHIPGDPELMHDLHQVIARNAMRG